MKLNRFLFIVSLTITLSTQFLFAQDDNLLSVKDFRLITFNGYDIMQLNATKGDPTSLEELYGRPSNYLYSASIPGEAEGHLYTYDGSNQIKFQGGEITSLNIVTPTWPIIVKGKSIRVGDSLDKIKQLLGNNIKYFLNRLDGSSYIVGFNTEGNSYEDIGIELDLYTKHVIKIYYYVIP